MADNRELVKLIGTLESEHVEVRDALAKIDSAVTVKNASALSAALTSGLGVLGTGLDSHSLAEDNDLFPAIAELMGEGLVSVFVEEHTRIRSLRDQIYQAMDRGDADFERSGEFSELLGDHIDREDAMLFPSARSMLAD